MFERLTIRTVDNDICYEVKKDIYGAYDILDLAKYIDDGDGEEANILLDISNRLAAYEDSGLSPDEVQELAQAKAEGRLVALPCRPGDKVYTIYRDECPCDICPHGDKYDYNSIKCLADDHLAGCYYKECPPPRYSIIEHICEGFTIHGDDNGNIIVSKPGEWGYEGLEEFYGYDGNIYFSREEAERAMKAIGGGGNETNPNENS